MDRTLTLKGLTTITILDNTPVTPLVLFSATNLKNGEFKPGLAFNEWSEDHADDGGEGGLGGLRGINEFSWDEITLADLDSAMDSTAATLKAEFTSKGKILTETIEVGDYVVANIVDGKAIIKINVFRPAGTALADVITITDA